MVAENRFDILIYRHHLRSSQLLEVTAVDTLGITLKITGNYLVNYEYHKFKAITVTDRDRWLKFLRNWHGINRSSYFGIQRNEDLKQSLPTTPDRFWPLNLWQISTSLKSVVDRVKSNRSDLEAKPEFNDCPFLMLITEEEKYINKLNIFLDPEAIPPPAILGSILRKLRRFHNGSFLSQLKEAYNVDPSNVLDCFIGTCRIFHPYIRSS